MKHTLFILALTLLFGSAYAQEKKFSDNPGVAGVQPVNKKIAAPEASAYRLVSVAPMAPATNVAKQLPATAKTTVANPAVANAHGLPSARVAGNRNAAPVAANTHIVQPAHTAASPAAARVSVAKPAPEAYRKVSALPIASATYTARSMPVADKKSAGNQGVVTAHAVRPMQAAGNKAIVPAAAVVIHPFKPLPVVVKKTPANAAAKTVTRNTPPITALNKLLNLPLLDPKYSTRDYEYKLIPEKVAGNLKEGDIITTEGYVQIVASEKAAVGDNNGDYQLQLTMRSERGDSCLIVAIPYAATIKDSGYAKIRKHIREALLEGKEPSEGGKMMRHAVYARVTGRLYYDAAHAIEMRSKPPVYKGKCARLSTQMHSYTAWEIHPVSHIEFLEKE